MKCFFALILFTGIVFLFPFNLHSVDVPSEAENAGEAAAQEGPNLPSDLEQSIENVFKGDESLEIKKSKIRGELSEGMICAEDELGLGISHDGIMVLDKNVIPGTPALPYTWYVCPGSMVPVGGY